MNEEFFNLKGGKKKMRTSEEINKELDAIPNYDDEPIIRQVYATCVLTEVLIDIRDILQRELSQLNAKG